MFVEFKIVPLASASQLSEAMMEVLELVEASGLAYQLIPTGVCIEGTSEEVIAVIQQCQYCVRQKSVLAIATFENNQEDSQSTQSISSLASIKQRLEHTFKQNC